MLSKLSLQPRWFPAHYRHYFQDRLSILMLPAQQPETGIRAFSYDIGVVMETIHASPTIDLRNCSDSERRRYVRYCTEYIYIAPQASNLWALFSCMDHVTCSWSCMLHLHYIKIHFSAAEWWRRYLLIHRRHSCCDSASVMLVAIISNVVIGG